MLQQQRRSRLSAAVDDPARGGCGVTGPAGSARARSSCGPPQSVPKAPIVMPPHPSTFPHSSQQQPWASKVTVLGRVVATGSSGLDHQSTASTG